MTTRHASFATGRSLIFEIAVTTVLFRPVSLTRPLSYQESRRLRHVRSPIGLRALEAIVGRALTLEHVLDPVAVPYETI